MTINIIWNIAEPTKFISVELRKTPKRKRKKKSPCQSPTQTNDKSIQKTTVVTINQ